LYVHLPFSFRYYSPGCPFFSQAEDGIRGRNVTGVQTCALPICPRRLISGPPRPPTRRNDPGHTSNAVTISYVGLIIFAFKMNCLSCGELWPLLVSYFCPEETYLHSPPPLYSGGTRFQAGAVSALFVFLPSIRSPAGTSLPGFGLVLAGVQPAAA